MPPRSHRFITPARILACCVALALAWPALALADTARFEINAEPLSVALKAFAQQSHMQLLYEYSIVQDVRGNAVIGVIEKRAALAQLLRNTGLEAVFSSNDAATIRPILAHDPSGAPAKQFNKDRRKKETKADSPMALNVAQERGAKHDVTDLKKGKSQEANTSPLLSEVVVTGTHIQGEAPVGVQLVTINSIQIEQSGYQTSEDLLQSLPMAFRGGAAGGTEDAGGNLFGRGANIGYNPAGASGVDLRGVGFDSTLVLVNGHRVASSAAGYLNADISTIPIWAIDHVDVLTDGASAIYGSDAIAGVVNIVLKSNAEGVRLGARDGGATEGGDHSTAYDAELGHQWSNGGVTVEAEFSKNGPVDVDQRPFSRSIGSPTDIFPAVNQTTLTGEFHQNVAEKLDIAADAEYSATDRTYINSISLPAAISLNGIHRWSGSVEADYQLPSSWTLRMEESAARGNESVAGYSTESGEPNDLIDSLHDTEKFSQQDISASGGLLSLPGGRIELAVGVSHRSEDYAHLQPYPTTAPSYHVGRGVRSAYAEAVFPIFSDVNSILGVRRLSLSLAGRYDHYSDFGSTINPKYGISWYPVSDLELRGAYSTSYRAPATGYELLDSQLGTTAILVYSIPNATSSQNIPVVFAAGAVPGLKPETASNTTLGFDYHPGKVPGLRVSANYYDINYHGQLASPPFEFNALSDPALAYTITRYPSSAALAAYVANAVREGAEYVDATGGKFGPNALASAVYLYDLRTRNLAETRTSGFDFEVHYPVRFGNELVKLSLSGTHIDKFDVKLSPSSLALSEVNTVGFPASLRLRTQAVWDHGPLNAAVAANYTGGYPDTSSASPRNVGAYITVDLVGVYDLSRLYPAITNRATFVVSITNLFDKEPPYVAEGSVYVSGSHYDAANANPLGRVITVGLSKQW